MILYPVPDFAKGKIIAFTSTAYSCTGEKWNFSTDLPHSVLSVSLSSLFTCLGIAQRPVAVLKQIHSSKVVFVDKPVGYGLIEGDGLITSRKDLLLGVLTADCYPVFLFDRLLSFIGIVHSGWRGAKKGILREAVETFRRLSNRDLFSIIGCGIGNCCYEVGNDFIDNFPREYFEERESKVFFDLRSFIKDSLVNLGVEVFYVEKKCSACSAECYSYRAERTLNRMLSGILFV